LVPPAFSDELISALLITIAVEGTIASGYSLWRKKPVGFILLSCTLANLVTQAFLWIALNVFFWHYIVTLWIAEILIWLFECACLFGFRFNRLNFREALGLSFILNLASFTLGWYLPV
jgi:hypothetical protein